MEESGGRRIKRWVNIDMTSISFCTPEMIEKFKKFQNISNYIINNPAKWEADKFFKKCFQSGFNIEKYGFKPKMDQKIEPIVIEKIVEKEIYINNDEDIQKIQKEKSELKEEIKELKIKLFEKDKEIVHTKDKLDNIINIIESNMEQVDFYGEDDDIIKKLINEIKRK
jgi:hypothetical protein